MNPGPKTIVQKYGGTSVGNIENIQKIAKRIHNQIASQKVRIAVVVSAMSGETNRLVDLIRRIDTRARSKHYDMVVAAGEQVAVGLIAAALESLGTRAEPLLAYQLGILTDTFHSRAKIRSVDSAKIETLWNAGMVPVVAGFQGITEDNRLTTLGRGGSDITAVALAVALNADYCEINTDVPGVFTCDPRINPDAQLIRTLDYDTALELAALGSKVLHNRCVEIGAKFQMPIVVRDSFDEDERRSTTLMTYSDTQALEAPVVSGITVDSNVAKVTLRNAFSIPKIFSELAEKGINVDIIVHDRSRTHDSQNVGFSVSLDDLDLTTATLKAFQGKDSPLQMETESDLSKVSVVGLGMRTHSGVACKVFDALEGNGIRILMISTSEIKISVVIEKESAERAVRLLHGIFFPEN